MRIISGIAKGHRLFAPPGLNTRPTADAVRESFFNIIQNLTALDGCAVLDLFAGSGAVGIEALSRGAREAVFVDSSAKSLAVIKRNLEKTGLSAKARVIRSDALAAVKSLNGAKFDLIYIDPPYETGLWLNALKCIADYGLLAQEGIAAAETAADTTDEETKDLPLELFKTAKYSSARILFFRN